MIFFYDYASIHFGESIILFGFIWYAVGNNQDGLDDLYGTQNAGDSFFLVLQMLTTGGYTDGIPNDHGYRIMYFAMIFIGPTIIFAILIGFIIQVFLR